MLRRFDKTSTKARTRALYCGLLCNCDSTIGISQHFSVATGKGFGAKEPEEGKGTSKVCCTFTGLPGTHLVEFFTVTLSVSDRDSKSSCY